MLRDRTSVLLYIVYPLLFIAMIAYDFFEKKEDKIVFVDTMKVFEKFQMSVEMKKIGEQELNQRKHVVDSLYRLLEDPQYAAKKEGIMKEFVFEKENLEAFTQKFAEEESSKIWQRIHSYATEYSRDKGYKIVLGMQPNETILYGDENSDVSNEFIMYLNSKYEGNK